MPPISCARSCGTTELSFHKLEPAGNFHSSQDLAECKSRLRIEIGISVLQGCNQRAERLIAIAAPPFSEGLRRAWRQSTWGKRAWH